MNNKTYTNSVKQKYSMFYERIFKAVQSGKFSTYTRAKKQSLYNRLQRYERRLKRWGIAVASATALFLTPMTATAQKAALGNEFQVNTYTSSSQEKPSMAMDNNGNSVIVWQSNGQGGFGVSIYAQRYDNTGATVGSEFLVSTATGGIRRNPSVAMDNDGDFVVAWDSYGQDGDSYGIYAQRYDNTGATVGSQFQVNTYTTSNQSYPTVAMDSDGDFVVTWMSLGQEGTSTEFGIYAQRYDNTGATVGSEFQVNTYTTSNQSYPSVAMDNDGDFVVTWMSRGQDDGQWDYGVYAQRYDNTGATVGSEFLVNTHTTNSQNYPTVAMDNDGDFVVAWTSQGQDDGPWDFGVFAQRYDNTGATVGSEFQVNTTTSGDQREPTVAMDDDGAFTVAWLGYGIDYSDIFAQQFDNTGAKVGSEFQVNTTTTSPQQMPAMAMDSDGDFVITWESVGGYDYLCLCSYASQDGSSTGVYAQRYGAAPTTIPTTPNTHTATAVETDADGYAVYTDASGNTLLKIKAPAGITIPASAVKIKVGATNSTYYNQYCGGSRNGGCFVRKTAGNALINRFWDIDKSQVTGGTISSATPIDLVFYFTQADFDALNTVLTNNGQSALSGFTDLQTYVVKNTAALPEFPSPTDIGNYRKVYRLFNSATSSTTKWKLENPSTGIYSMEMKVIRIDNGGGIGVFF